MFGLFRSIAGLFKAPDYECKVSLVHQTIAVQRRGSGDDAEFHLRFSQRGEVQYYEISRAQMHELASALTDVAGEAHERNTP